MGVQITQQRLVSKWKELCDKAGGCRGLKERDPFRTHIELNAQHHRKARSNLGDSTKSQGSTQQHSGLSDSRGGSGALPLLFVVPLTRR